MTAPTQLSSRVAALLEESRATRGRLIFACDCTASREPTWDTAMQVQISMFQEAAKIGGLEVQLVYFRGSNEVRCSSWFDNPHELVKCMSTIKCMAGATKIARVFQHIRAENARKKVNAVVLVGDAIEEAPDALCATAAELGVPVFVFQEGSNMVMPIDQHGRLMMTETSTQSVESVFREIARLSSGAYARFDVGAAGKLGELLAAVAAFTVGGLTALANLRTDSARKLLGQIKD